MTSSPASSPKARKSSALLVVLLFIAPAITAGIVSGQSGTERAEDEVAIADGSVPWRSVQNMKTVLYFTPPGGDARNGDHHLMRAYPFSFDPDTQRMEVPDMRYYGAATSLQGTAGTHAVIRSIPLTHDVTVAGDNALTVHWEGRWEERMTWRVILNELPEDGGREKIANGTTQCAPGGVENACTVALRISDPDNPGAAPHTPPRKLLRAGSTLEVTIRAEGGSTPWAFRTGDRDRPSFLEITSEDAVKAATWTADYESRVRDSFRPDYTTQRPINKMEGFFAVKTAFGISDYYDEFGTTDPEDNVPDRTFNPKAHVYWKANETSYPITIGAKKNLTEINLVYDEANSSLEQGLLVYRFEDRWDYGEWPFPRGEFVLQTRGTFRPDDGTRQAQTVEATWDFVISTQEITIRPYDDKDPDTLPSPLEAQDHEMAAGGTTTFLALVRNDGDVVDNFTLDIRREASDPVSGWHASVTGERVRSGNLLHLGPGEEALVQITVRAPADARAGHSALYSLSAVSGVDPRTKSDPFSVIATVTDNVREGVDVVFLNDTEEVQRGKEKLTKVYLWNRGTRPADLRLRVDADIENPQWNITIDQNSVNVNETTLLGVPPGALAPVTLRVHPNERVQGQETHTVILNASLAAGGGPARDRELTFRVVEFASFRVELMRGINSVTRFLEMECPPPTSQSADPGAGTYAEYCGDYATRNYKDDAVDGTLYRVWVTNTGDVTDDFTVRAVSAREVGEVTDVRSNAFGQPQVGIRDAKGRFPDGASNELRIRLDPGKTGEVYVWVPHEQDAGRFKESEFSFVVSVKSETTKRELRRAATAIGWNEEFSRSRDLVRAVRLEAVERTEEYFSGTPIVNVKHKDDRAVEKLVDLSGRPAYFRLRVTNGASFATFDEEETTGNASVHLRIQGAELARQNGWNVSMRLRNGDDNPRTNPWMESLWIENRNYENGQRWESFRDAEVELKVVPPVGGGPNRVVAGQVQTVTLRAEFPGTGVYDEIELASRVAPVPNVTLSAVRLEEPIHAGEETAFILNIANNGTRATAFNVTARLDEPVADGWGLNPDRQNLNLTEQENQTVALIVNAPSNAAVGSQALVNVTLAFPRVPGDPNSEIVRRYLELTATVKAPGKLDLTATPTTTTITPGGRANFTLDLTNLDNRDIPYEVSVTPMKNWTQSTPPPGVVTVGQVTRIPLMMQAPTEVVQGRLYEALVKVTERDNPDNFAVARVGVNIVGGKPLPVVNAVQLDRLVDRGGEATYEFAVRNIGSASGSFPLQVRVAQPGWSAFVQDVNGNNVSRITVDPNGLARLFVTVRAPLNVPEGTTAPVTLTAFSPEYDRSNSATVRAAIHDYGVDVQLSNARADVVPGESAEFLLTVTNTGNGEDNLTIAPDLQSLAGWSAYVTAEQVTLQPGATAEVRLVVTSSKEPLPSPRAYTMNVHGGTAGGNAVGLPRNDSAPLVVNVLNYRPYDVDGDGFLELAVDKNKRPGDGFEHFREIFSEGTRLVEVDNLSGKQDGRITFLLDSDASGALDGIADLYFDPNDLFVYVIRYWPDINGDSRPDYLLDTDDDGVIDHAWDPSTRTLWPTTVVRVYGGTREQFLIDLNGDGEPDRYFDPDAADGRGLVTRTIPQADGRVGLDVDNSGKATKYFDVESGELADARVSSLSEFAREFWYFFAGFALVIVIAGVVLARRRRYG